LTWLELRFVVKNGSLTAGLEELTHAAACTCLAINLCSWNIAITWSKTIARLGCTPAIDIATL
jgi:hypothetical protein